MPDKVMSSPMPSRPVEPGQAEPNPGGGADQAGTLPVGNSLRPVRVQHEDGITNPRDGRGPLRPRDDQSAKLPLRPPH